VTLFVDTSVWSLALRRDAPSATPQVDALLQALKTGQDLATTGLVLQELLQGFSGPRAREQLISRFSAVPFVAPDRDDHIEAADLRNRCRRRGVQVGTIDAILAQLCIRYDLTMLTADRDFGRIAAYTPLRLWG